MPASPVMARGLGLVRFILPMDAAQSDPGGLNPRTYHRAKPGDIAIARGSGTSAQTKNAPAVGANIAISLYS
jgi:hypothetical protein